MTGGSNSPSGFLYGLERRRAMKLPEMPDQIMPSGNRKRQALSDGAYGTLLVAPAILVMLFFGLFPLFYAMNLSLRHVDLTTGLATPWKYVGLENFRYSLNSEGFIQASAR